MFQAVQVTGERRRKARAVIFSTVQLAGLEGCDPRWVLSPTSHFPMEFYSAGHLAATGVAGTSSRLRMLSALHKPVWDVQ